MRIIAKRRTPVLSLPGFLEGAVIETDEGLYAQVFVSHIVEDTDPIAHQWSDVVREYCNVVTNRAEFEDPDMYFGGGMFTMTRLFERCPGDAVPHNCLIRRITVPHIVRERV